MRSTANRDRNGGIPLLAAAAAPIPITRITNIDVNRFCMAVGANAATTRHGAKVFGQLPFRHAFNLDVSSLTGGVTRSGSAADSAIVFWAAITRRDHHRTLVMALDGFENAHQLRLEAAGINLVGLQVQAVGRKPGQACSRSQLNVAG